MIKLCAIFVFVLFAMISCKENAGKKIPGDEIISTSGHYRPSKLIDSLAKVFLDSSACKNCINEIYMDKVSVDESYITFRATTYNKLYHDDYLRKQNPLFYFIKEDQKFFLITGAEAFVSGDQENAKALVFPVKKENKIQSELIVQFKLLKDSVFMLRVAGVPFMPEMDQHVLPGDSILFKSGKNYSN